jgi:hypothetical protein
MLTQNEFVMLMLGLSAGIIAMRLLGFVPRWRAYEDGKDDERHRIYAEFDLPQYQCLQCGTRMHKPTECPCASGKLVFRTDET